MKCKCLTEYRNIKQVNSYTIIITIYKAVYIMLFVIGNKHKTTLFQRPRYKTIVDNNNIYEMSFGCCGIQLGGTIANTMLRRHTGLIKYIAFGTYRFLVGFRGQWKTTFRPLHFAMRLPFSFTRHKRVRYHASTPQTIKHGYCCFVRVE